jgi:putative transposase
VDTQGHLLAVKVTGAHHSDQQGTKSMLERVRAIFPTIKLLWGDSHYAGQLITWLKVHLGWSVQIVRRLKVPQRGLLVPEGTEVEWDSLFPPGFQPLPRRWVVERTFAWIIRGLRLCRDHEGLPESSEAFITLAASRRMLSLLAPEFP